MAEFVEIAVKGVGGPVNPGCDIIIDNMMCNPSLIISELCGAESYPCYTRHRLS